MKTEINKIDENLDCKGIYFLYLNDLIVYVGMSNISVLARILGFNRSSGHIHDKLFNFIEVFEMNNSSKYSIQQNEEKLIKKYNPFYNTTFCNPSKINHKFYKDLEMLEDFERKKRMKIINSFDFDSL